MSFPALPQSSQSIPLPLPLPLPQTSSTMQTNDENDRLLEFRNATNLRSVRRADPAVSSILETSVYSTVYYYDESGGRWEKQKQEGPLFVVRRDKVPEYALYMLNRQTVKNPVIPLIPGEMKVTIVDQAMLQVARRGEKLRTAIWFSEGPEAVERFRSAVLQICGEPSKKSNTPALSTASPAIPLPPPSGAPAQNEDGLSRLFAGLMKSPPVQSPPVPSASPRVQRDVQPPAPPANAQTTTTFTTTTSSITHNQSMPIAAGEAPIIAPVSQQPQFIAAPTHSPAPTSQSTSPPPAMPTMPTGPPGQTADDLLMSILGLAPPIISTPPPAPSNGPLPANAGSNAFPRFPPPEQALPQQQFHQLQLPLQLQGQGQPQQPFLPPNGHQYPQAIRTNVGDATFAQAAATAAAAVAAGNGPSPLYHPASPLPQHMSSPATHAHSPINGFRGNLKSRSIAADSLVETIERKERDEGISIAGIGLGAEQRKAEFARRLTDLILTDERFVDDLWTRYLDRMSRGGGG